MKPTRVLIPILAVLTALLAIGLSPGCTSSAELQELRADAQATRDSRAATLDTAAAELAAAREHTRALELRVDQLSRDLLAAQGNDGVLRDQLEAVRDQLAASQRATDQLAQLRDSLAAEVADLDTRLAKADARIAAAADPNNPGEVLGTAVGALIPGLGTALPALLGAGYVVLKQQQAKQSLRLEVEEKSTAIDKIVTSVDTLAELEPAVAEAFTKHKHAVDAVQGPVAKRYVDRAQAGGVAVTRRG